MARRRAAPRFDDKRPPLVRLESLVAEPAVARSRRILMRIRMELNGAPYPDPWISAARSLAERGQISADTVIYFVEIFLECVTRQASGCDPEMLRLYDEMHRVERAHGLGEDESWLTREAPAEWLELNEAWDRRNDAIRVATLRDLGHGDIADLLERQPAEFNDRGSAGHHDLWGEIDDDAD
jgi:hypothetical protein